MLHLHFGNRLEDLADALGRDLDRAWSDPLEPPAVVVPSPAVGQWLRFRLASRGRTLLNLPTIALEAFLWESLEPGGESILRVEALRHAVAGVLDERLLGRPEFEAPGRYLRRADGSVDPSRRAQLSAEMARLFLEYEYNRPSVWKDGRWKDGIDRSWPDRPWFGGRADADGEAWQRILHGAVFAPDGPLSGSGLMGLPRLHRLRRECGKGASPGRPALLLSVDKTSHFHRNLLLELSLVREVSLYLVNPCMEFWEDVDTSRRRIRRPARSLALRRLTGEEYLAADIPSDLWDPAADPPLLRLWGKTSRENTVLWSQAADHDFEDHGVDPLAEGGPTLLKALQSSLLRRDPAPPPEAAGALGDDGSIRVLAAPEALREIEAVRDCVFQWLSEDPSRRPSDALVLLPDPPARAAEIDAVFGARAPGSPGRIPWAMLGARGTEGCWSGGARLLLETWRRGMDRRRVLALSRNPLVRGRRKLTESDVAEWPGWMRGAGVLSGWDPSDRIRSGRAADLSPRAHTFRAGILRLCAAPFSGEPVADGGDMVLPWRDRGSSDPTALDAFLSFCEDLHAGTAVPPDGDLASQGRRFLELCDAWMDPGGDPAEEATRRSLSRAVGGFRFRGDGPADPDELEEALLSALDAESPGPASAFGGALTFAPLRPGQILPHGLVVVAGLDDGFPGDPRASTLDLLSRHRIFGDAEPLAESRHAFLVALLSARDRLVLSWTARDLRKDVARPPSPLVLELEAALRGWPIGGTGGPTPLRRAVSLLARAGGILEGDPPAWEVPSWDPDDLPETVEKRDDPPLGAARRPDLDDLRSFLESPFLQRARSGARLPEGEGEDDASSPLFPAVPALHRLCSGIVDGIWSKAEDPAAAVDRIVGMAAWDDGIPESDFLEALRSRLRAWASRIAPAVAAVPVRFPVRSLPDLVPDRSWPAELPGGSARWSGIGEGGEIVLADLVSFSSARPKPERKARLYLAGGCLRGAGAGPARLLWIERMGDGRVVEEALPERADGAWIRDLGREFVDPSRTEHIPLSVAASGARDAEGLRSELSDGRRWRPELEKLLAPDFPDLPEPELMDLCDRIFAPWRST